MNTRVFWFAVFLCATIVVHLAYVLLLPGYRMERIIAEAEEAVRTNTLAVLPDAQQRLIFGSSQGFATAVCPFDLADGSARLEAVFPAVPWTLAIYSGRGIPVYAVNDRQTGADRFAVKIRSSGALSDLLRANDEPISQDGDFTVETYGSRGLVVLRATVPDPTQRDFIANVLRQSKCTIAS